MKKHEQARKKIKNIKKHEKRQSMKKLEKHEKALIDLNKKERKALKAENKK